MNELEEYVKAIHENINTFGMMYKVKTETTNSSLEKLVFYENPLETSRNKNHPKIDTFGLPASWYKSNHEPSISYPDLTGKKRPIRNMQNTQESVDFDPYRIKLNPNTKKELRRQIHGNLRNISYSEVGITKMELPLSILPYDYKNHEGCSSIERAFKWAFGLSHTLSISKKEHSDSCTQGISLNELIYDYICICITTVCQELSQYMLLEIMRGDYLLRVSEEMNTPCVFNIEYSGLCKLSNDEHDRVLILCKNDKFYKPDKIYPYIGYESIFGEYEDQENAQLLFFLMCWNVYVYRSTFGMNAYFISLKSLIFEVKCDSITTIHNNAPQYNTVKKNRKYQSLVINYNNQRYSLYNVPITFIMNTFLYNQTVDNETKTANGIPNDYTDIRRFMYDWNLSLGLGLDDNLFEWSLYRYYGQKGVYTQDVYGNLHMKPGLDDIWRKLNQLSGGSQKENQSWELFVFGVHLFCAEATKELDEGVFFIGMEEIEHDRVFYEMGKHVFDAIKKTKPSLFNEKLSPDIITTIRDGGILHTKKENIIKNIMSYNYYLTGVVWFVCYFFLRSKKNDDVEQKNDDVEQTTYILNEFFSNHVDESKKKKLVGFFSEIYKVYHDSGCILHKLKANNTVNASRSGWNTFNSVSAGGVNLVKSVYPFMMNAISNSTPYMDLYGNLGLQLKQIGVAPTQTTNEYQIMPPHDFDFYFDYDNYVNQNLMYAYAKGDKREIAKELQKKIKLLNQELKLLVTIETVFPGYKRHRKRQRVSSSIDNYAICHPSTISWNHADTMITHKDDNKSLVNTGKSPLINGDSSRCSYDDALHPFIVHRDSGAVFKMVEVGKIDDDSDDDDIFVVDDEFMDSFYNDDEPSDVNIDDFYGDKLVNAFSDKLCLDTKSPISPILSDTQEEEEIQCKNEDINSRYGEMYHLWNNDGLNMFDDDDDLDDEKCGMDTNTQETSIWIPKPKIKPSS